MRITCDESGCSEDLILPTTDASVVVSLAEESGWTCVIVEAGGYPREFDRCAVHSA